MQMLYNSEHFAVVQIEVPMPGPEFGSESGPEPATGRSDWLARGGYEIVDKQTRRGVFLDGALAERFKAGVEALVQRSPSAEEIDEYLAGFTGLAHHPVVLH